MGIRQASNIKILPPPQLDCDQFADERPRKPFVTRYSHLRKLSKPEVKIPLFFAFRCELCDEPIVIARDGACTYDVAVLDIGETEVLANVIRPHRCRGKKAAAEQAAQP